MKIYTKTGDGGTTSLIGGERVSKADPRVEAYGTVDELAAHLGLLGDFIVAGGGGHPAITDALAEIQKDLMVVMSVLATPTCPASRQRTPEGGVGRVEKITQAIGRLEMRIDALDVKFTGFVAAGGDVKISQAHVCRTVCRRAERRAVAAGAEDAMVGYLNRLSDWCFAVSIYFISFAQN